VEKYAAECPIAWVHYRPGRAAGTQIVTTDMDQKTASELSPKTVAHQGRVGDGNEQPRLEVNGTGKVGPCQGSQQANACTEGLPQAETRN